MKKILLATSAVALFAGAAAAEVTTTGTARMGIVYADDGTTSSTQFSSRVRIIFTASGETDSGLSFGASVRNDQSGVGGTANGDSTVFISGAFGKLTMGDVSGAADSLVGQTSGVGYGPNDGLQEINFIGAGKTAIYYEYSTGAFTLGVGSGQLDTAVDTASIGAKYSTDAYSVALAYEQSNSAAPAFDFSMISASASAKFGAATLKARVSDKDVAGQDVSWSVSADYTMGATTLTAFYTDFGNNTGSGVAGGNDATPAGSTDTTHIGIGASYDLGGGATVAGGIIRQNNTGVADATIADVGLKFSF
ncbi:MAG: porin [Tabrizicola sp.]